MLNWFRNDKPPLPEQDQSFVERSFLWFAEQFSWQPALGPCVLPNASYFPDSWSGSDEDLERMFARLCGFMRVPEERVHVEIFASESDPISELVPFGSRNRSGPAGLFIDPDDENAFVIGVNHDELSNPLSVVATLAHELAHVHLLGDKRLSPEAEDHERLTDLLTVFFGLGIFTANSAFQFSQWQEGGLQGWSTQRMGYLDEPALGYALACYAWVRSEQKPSWAKYLTTGVAEFFHKSERWIPKSSSFALPRQEGGVASGIR